MRVSRRVFMGAVAAAPVLTRAAAVTRARCSVADLGCVVYESLAGFRTQVGGLRYKHGDADILIVPGIDSLGENNREMIQSWLDRGATVLLEYGGGTRISGDIYFPYVEYTWPVPVKIREFAPVALQPGPQDQTIATFHGQPVGLRRRAGDGTLVTLGSPIGPVFLTGDPDAGRWLNAFLAAHRV